MNSFLKITGYTIRDQMRHKSFYVLLGLSILFVLMIRGCYNGQYVVSGKQLDSITVAWHVSKIVFQVIASGMFLIVILLLMKIFSKDHEDGKPGIVSFQAGFPAAIHYGHHRWHMVFVPGFHVYSSRNDFSYGVGKNRRHHSRVFNRIAGMFDQSSLYCGFGVLLVSLFAGFHQRGCYCGDFIRRLYFRRWSSDLKQRNFKEAVLSAQPCPLRCGEFYIRKFTWCSPTPIGSSVKQFYDIGILHPILNLFFFIILITALMLVVFNKKEI